MSRKKRPRPAPAAPSGKRGNALTASDLVIAGLFIGSVIFCVAAFATAVSPIQETFMLWPALIGGALGAGVGALYYWLSRKETLGFMAGLGLVVGALLAVGLVLALNRPLDRSPEEVHSLPVLNRYNRGTELKPHYCIEVDDYPVVGGRRHLSVEVGVYDAVSPGGQLEVVTRRGFFGFPYQERVQLRPEDLLRPAGSPPDALPATDLAPAPDAAPSANAAPAAG